jgi:hypothetical protein
MWPNSSAMTKSSMAINEIATTRSRLNFRKPRIVSLTKLSADDRRAHKTRDLWTSSISDRNRRIPFCIESGHWRVRLRRTPMFCFLLSLKMRLPHLYLGRRNIRRSDCTLKHESPSPNHWALIILLHIFRIVYKMSPRTDSWFRLDARGFRLQCQICVAR